jgi:hypothetical protein
VKQHRENDKKSGTETHLRRKDFGYAKRGMALSLEPAVQTLTQERDNLQRESDFYVDFIVQNCGVGMLPRWQSSLRQ